MDEQKSVSKSKFDKLHEYIANGDFVEFKKLIINDINIYSRTAENESPLHLALQNQQPHMAAIIWKVYKNDLKSIQLSYRECRDKFWTKKPIFIVYGAENMSSFTKLYDEYQKWENEFVDENRCVMFLLKRDNLSPEKVLCFTPKTKTGTMLTIRMIKCVLPNGLLDLQAQSNYNWSIIEASAKAGMSPIFLEMVNLGIESDHTNIVLKAIQYGHVEFLAMFYRKFPSNAYEFFRLYCFRILGSNIWSVFEFYAEKIKVEKRISWTEMINYRLPFRNFTVFEYAIKYDLIGILEPMIEYKFDFAIPQINVLGLLGYIKWDYKHPESYQRIVMKIIQRDPTQLEIVDTENYKICHKLVSGLCLPELVQFFAKYPDAKKIFFTRQDIALKFITDMLSREQFDTVKYLLENSTDHLSKHSLYTILNHLARDNNIELFVYVMSLAEYDFTVPIKPGVYPIITALDNRNPEIFNMMWSKVKNGRVNKILHEQILQSAIKKPDGKQLLDEILAKCSDMESLQDPDRSLFHGSAVATIEFKYNDILLPTHYAQNVAMFKLLDTNIVLKANGINKHRENQLTLMHNCKLNEASDAALELIQYLLENGGCDINEEVTIGRASIYYARTPEIAKCLLKYRPALNCIDKEGNTPIHYAFINNLPNVAYVLLEDESVDYSIQNNNRWSYLKCLVTEEYNYGDLNVVLSNMNSKLRTYLVEHCNDSFENRTPVIFEALKNNLILSNLLLTQPTINLFVHDAYNRNTLLHVAMLHGRVDTVDFLIDRGLNINEQNVDGDTPLNLYCKFSVDICGKVIGRYLKHNPDVLIKNNRGMSPILYVASKDLKGEAVCELLAHGASLTDIDPENGTWAYHKLTVKLQEVFNCCYL